MPDTKQVGVNWELANADAVDWARRHSSRFMDDFDTVTRDKIRRSVAGYVEGGENLGQLRDRIATTGAFNPERAKLIARTEVTAAYAEGNLTAWKESDVVEGKEWNTRNDEIVCSICGPLDGTTVPLNGEFEGAGHSPPAHAGCRCWVTPVVMGDLRTGAEIFEEYGLAREPGIGAPVSTDQITEGIDGKPIISDGLRVLKKGEMPGMGWDQFESLEQAKAKKQLVTELSERMGVPYDKADEIIHQWALGSNKDYWASLHIQEMASQEFGYALSEWQQGWVTEWSEAVGREALKLEELLPDEDMKAFIRGMYDSTQEQFRAAGIDTVKLYRGINIDDVGLLDRMSVGDLINLDTNVLESFSAERGVAEYFGDVVIEINAPVKNIVSTARTGFGCLNEWEMVVTGDYRAKVLRMAR